MASTYTQPKKNEEDLKQQLQEQAAQSASATATQDLQKVTAQAAGAGGYVPSAQVQQAQQYVQQLQQQKPAAYESALTPQLTQQFEAIMNRQPFRYDLGSDPLFQQYTDQYVQKGRRAMQDTMGQAAAMTGGYGNSYAQGAGQAAYGNYLQELNAMAPQFQQNAYTRWQGEGAEMMDRYNALQTREENEYGRYQDAVNAYYADLDRAQQAADNAYDREYGQYMDQLNYDQQKAEWEQKVQSENRDYAYNTALMILQGGQMPSSELLKAAGLSEADAKALMAMYAPKKSSSGSGDKKNTTTSAGNKENPFKKTLAQQVADGDVKVTNSDVDDGILSIRDYTLNRQENDAFFDAQRSTVPKNVYAMEKENERVEEEYKDYVAESIASQVENGLISRAKGLALTKKYLLADTNK